MQDTVKNVYETYLYEDSVKNGKKLSGNFTKYRTALNNDGESMKSRPQSSSKTGLVGKDL